MKINILSGTAAPLEGNDIDTDQIIPARYLIEITFENMGKYLFADLRYNPDQTPTDFILNKPEFANPSILFVDKNFGCGSSREHAPQAIKRYGIKALVGESFAEIFSGNCLALGIPLVTVAKNDLDKLKQQAYQDPTTIFTLDLEKKTVSYHNVAVNVDLLEERRQSFLKGTWDVISLLKQNESKIDQLSQKLPYLSW